MRIANTVSDSIVDGPGLRFTVFTQGCPHRCPGCHNPGTHDPAGGREVSVAELAAELSGNPLTDGLTLSGGEPFCQAAECAALARIARERGLNVWAYTGYTYERLLAGEVPDALALLEQVDVLVDGPFVEAEKSYAALFRGSANQRLIDVPKSLAAGRWCCGSVPTPWPTSPGRSRKAGRTQGPPLQTRMTAQARRGGACPRPPRAGVWTAGGCECRSLRCACRGGCLHPPVCSQPRAGAQAQQKGVGGGKGPNCLYISP